MTWIYVPYAYFPIRNQFLITFFGIFPETIDDAKNWQLFMTAVLSLVIP